MEYKSFETERLLLKPTSDSDAEFIYELLNTPKWLKNIGDRGVKSVEDAQNYIKVKMNPQLERLGYGNYTVVRKEDGEKIGSCGLYDREGLEGIDIGFAFLPQYERKGYALEASKKIRDVAFNEFDINTISAITTHENKASQKLLERIGLLFIETTFLPNDDEELLVYKLEK